MKKLLFLITTIFLISCTKDDGCTPCENYLDPVADSYGAYIKTTAETTVYYRFISPYRDAPDENETGEFGEEYGYHFRIFRHGEITVNGDRHLSFPVTDVEKNELYINSSNAYEPMFFELRIIDGNKDDVESFWVVKNADSFLVDKDNRNPNATNVLEENKCNWIIEDNDSGYYSGDINLKGHKLSQEWINGY